MPSGPVFLWLHSLDFWVAWDNQITRFLRFPCSIQLISVPVKGQAVCIITSTSLIQRMAPMSLGSHLVTDFKASLCCSPVWLCGPPPPSRWLSVHSCPSCHLDGTFPSSPVPKCLRREHFILFLLSSSSELLFFHEAASGDPPPSGSLLPGSSQQPLCPLSRPFAAPASSRLRLEIPVSLFLYLKLLFFRAILQLSISTRRVDGKRRRGEALTCVSCFIPFPA